MKLVGLGAPPHGHCNPWMLTPHVHTFCHPGHQQPSEQGSPVHTGGNQGSSVPSASSHTQHCSDLINGVHTGFPFGLTIFPSHVPPGSEGLLDRCLTKPCTWLWGMLHSRPPSSRPTDESLGLGPCPLPLDPLCPETPAQGVVWKGPQSQS